MTPAWRNRASTAMSGLAIAAVCDDAARTPAADRPLLTATIGLRRDTRRAMRANLRGLPNDSRYSRTTSVPGSSSQYWSRSLPLTSALLPTDTKLDTPSPMRADRSRMAMPSAPDWDCMAMRPGPAAYGENVASRPIAVFDDTEAVRADEPHAVAAGEVAQFGLRADLAHLAEPGAQHHDSRHTLRRALAHDLDHGERGDGDDRQVDGARDVEHGRIRLHAGDLLGAGIDRIHRPGEPTGEQVAEHLVPDGVRVPAGADDRDRPRSEQAGHRCCLGPMLSRPRRQPAPGRWVRSAARRARRRPRRGSVPRTRRPRNTPSIWRFWASVWPTNRVIPRSRAAAARCSSRTVPIPRPWCSSLTTNATSAESVPGSRS